MRNGPNHCQLKRSVSESTVLTQMGTLTVATVVGMVVVTINDSAKIATNSPGTPRVTNSEPLLHLLLLCPRMLM